MLLRPWLLAHSTHRAMVTSTAVIILLFALFLATAYRTLLWQLRRRLYRPPPARDQLDSPDDWLVAFAGLTAIAGLAVKVAVSYSPPQGALAVAWRDDKLMALAWDACVLVVLPVCTFAIGGKLDARRASPEAGNVMLWAVAAFALVMIVSSVGYVITGEVSPPLASLSFTRQLFFVYKGTVVYVVYFFCAVAVLLVQPRYLGRAITSAQSATTLAYVLYFFGMFFFRIQYPDFYKHDITAFLNDVRVATATALLIFIGLHHIVWAGRAPARHVRWFRRAMIANVLLAVALPFVVEALEKVIEVARSNAVAIVSGALVSVPTALIGILLQRSFRRQGVQEC